MRPAFGFLGGRDDGMHLFHDQGNRIDLAFQVLNLGVQLFDLGGL